MAIEMGVVRQEAEGSAVRFERRFSIPPSELWTYLTEPEHLAGWMTPSLVFEPWVGGRVIFNWAGSPPTLGAVKSCDPPSLLEYTWDERGNHSLVRLELIPEGDHTLLVIDHSGLLNDALGFAAGWHSHVDQLEHILSGAASPFDEKARFQELVKSYGWTPSQ